MRHRKYFPKHHPYLIHNFFYDKQEHGSPPQPLSEEAIYFKLKDMIFSCRKKSRKTLHNEGGNDYWKRRSYFFKLPYLKKTCMYDTV